MLERVRAILRLGPAPGALRRTDLKRAPEGPIARARGLAAHPVFIPTLIIALALVAVTSGTVWWARAQAPLAPGRVMDRTIVVRTEFRVLDAEATRRARDDARSRAPRLYDADEAVFQSIEQSLLTLPTVLASAPSLAEVAPEIREAFGLTEPQFEAIRAETAGGEATGQWQNRVARLMRRLEREPLLPGEEYQRALQSGTDRIELRRGPGADNILKDAAIAIDSERFAEKVRAIAESCGFSGPRLDAVVHRLTHNARPTYAFNRDATEQRREDAARSIPDQLITYRLGDVIVQRGEALSETDYDIIQREHAEFRAQLPAAARWLPLAGVAGLMSVIVFALLGYLRQYYPRILRSPARFAGVAALLGVTAAVTVWLGVNWPASVWLTSLGPVLLVAMILIVAYDPRVAMVLGAVQGVVIGIALDMPVGYFAVVAAGIAIAGWRMREVRSRNDVIGASILVAVAAGLATLIIGLLDRPLGVGTHALVLREILSDALRAAVGGFAAGALTLVLMPAIERLFGVVTGMTLSEWRDPRQPLLRELQQRAPGTFNHSHGVATLAEAAAEAIGADGLHLYVGALYHDIGKMIKPEYFVENQGGGHNKHARLSPAMSLLVIVGHVKDGLELAREYGLPESLHHYIESHHGTTLVQYFFEAARRQAVEGRSDDEPEEIEYRYPGPRPRTREAAILMIADAVESATRAMAEPTPARIAALVHSIAHKRLMDGQFDDCGLTLRELAAIEEAITKGLCAIYHGRIAYPTESVTEDGEGEAAASRAAAEQSG